jgi:hypothetical protein
MLLLTSPCALPKSAIPEYAFAPLTSVVAGDKARSILPRRFLQSRCCDRCCTSTSPCALPKRPIPESLFPSQVLLRATRRDCLSAAIRECRCCDRCCLPPPPAHCRKEQFRILLIPLTSVVAGDKARLVVASNTVNLVIVTAVIDGDKARLLVRGNPVIAVVATDVAFHLPLRTAEKRNPEYLIPLTSVVAGDKARLIVQRRFRAEPLLRQMLHLHRPAHCRKEQIPEFAYSPHKCCCERQGATAPLHKSLSILLRQVLPSHLPLRTAEKRNP